jgi:hypothetical protein
MSRKENKASQRKFSHRNRSWIVLSLLAAVVVVVVGGALFKVPGTLHRERNGRPEEVETQPTPSDKQGLDSAPSTDVNMTPAQTPPTGERKKKSLAAPGRQEYSISSAHRSPQFYKAVIDPEDVRVGEKQTMTVYVKDGKAQIVEVIADIETDNGAVKHPLTLKSGRPDDGVWEGSWVVHDTHDTTYVTVFTAKNSLGETAQSRLSWTDPGCGCTGTDCTVSSSCTVSGVDGADGGTLTVSGSITVPAGATLVYGSTLNVSGTLNVNSTGVLQSGDICMTDADSDGYAANTTQYADGSSCASGRRRRYLMASITTLDCYESNGNAHPNQTAYFTYSRGDGSYDYNCDGSTTKNSQYNCTYDARCITGIHHAGYQSSIPNCGQSATFVIVGCNSNTYCGDTSFTSHSYYCNSGCGWQSTIDYTTSQTMSCH